MVSTSARPLPMPGIVLGPYPQRDQVELPGAFESALSSTWADLPWVRQNRLNRLEKWAQDVQAAMPSLPKFPSKAFRDQLNEQRATMARDGLDSDAAVQTCAQVALAIKSLTGFDLRPPQLMAVRVVLDGALAEMATGAGKTLATACAATIAALAGIPVHVLCANDYLAERDCKQLLPLFRLLGVSAKSIKGEMSRGERREAYACDIVYCAARELVFDYLRDRLIPAPRSTGEHSERVLRGLCMAIIDEADSVLIDEAVTPFILSENYSEPEQIMLCKHALELAQRLSPNLHYRLDRAEAKAQLTPAGLQYISDSAAEHDLAEAAHGCGALWAIPRYRQELLQTALHAHLLLRRDEHYIVRNGKVELIDAHTGRIAEGRAWSRGLQQMVELREGCPPSPATRVLAQITYPRIFPRYHMLAGLSGTLREARRELLQAYGLAVQVVPTGFPPSLKIAAPRVFAHSEDRITAVVAAIAREHAKGRPVLVGSDSVAESEHLSLLLQENGLAHQLLNARQDKQEAELVARAGEAGQITVATNMAGRGTDIQIKAAVAAAGGLHVISCQYNSARRIDRQLFGRAARQGQPGSAEVLLALDEGLAARHLSPGIRLLLSYALRPGRTMPLVIARAIIRFTHWQAESRAMKGRAQLRQQDEHIRTRLHIGGATE